jgi:hypothetical protein
MDYLFYQLWPMVLLALIMGGIWGYYTCPGAGSSDRDD